MSLFQLTILTDQGHISELPVIFWGSKGRADCIARKGRKFVGFQKTMLSRYQHNDFCPSIEFGFGSKENYSQTGSQNSAHAALLFRPKLRGVSGPGSEYTKEAAAVQGLRLTEDAGLRTHHSF